MGLTNSMILLRGTDWQKKRHFLHTYTYRFIYFWLLFSAGNFTFNHGKPYCTPHYVELFKKRGLLFPRQLVIDDVKRYAGRYDEIDDNSIEAENSAATAGKRLIVTYFLTAFVCVYVLVCLSCGFELVCITHIVLSGRYGERERAVSFLALYCLFSIGFGLSIDCQSIIIDFMIIYRILQYSLYDLRPQRCYHRWIASARHDEEYPSEISGFANWRQ